MAEHECIYKDTIAKIADKQDSIGEDIAVIKSYLIGNGREGLVKKVDRHDKLFNMIAGGSALIGFTFAAVKVFG